MNVGIRNFFVIILGKNAVLLQEKPVKNCHIIFFGCRGVRGWSSAHHHNKKKKKKELGDTTLCFGNKEAAEFHFWEYINGNQTFILDFHRPFICSAPIEFHFWEYINGNQTFILDFYRPFICSAPIEFHFWEYINGNQTFILDFHRPFICSTPIEFIL